MTLHDLEDHITREGVVLANGTVEIATGEIMGGDVYVSLTREHGKSGIQVEMMGGTITVTHEATSALRWCTEILTGETA